MRNSGRVLPSISWVLIFVGIFLSVYPVSADDIASSKKAARDAYSLINSRWFSSKEKAEAGLFKPVSSDQLMYSLDNQTSGNAKLMCPGEDPALIVTVHPGTTGDLDSVVISYDLDLDGTFKTLTVPGPVSGVCLNGFVKCTPNTWSDCSWFKWTVESGNLSYVPVNFDEVGGCYCFNNSCTSSSFSSYKDHVLETLGAGILSVLSRYMPRVSTGNGKIEGYKIEFFSQRSSDCVFSSEGSAFGYAVSSPEEYMDNPSLMTADAAGVVAAQSGDPESFYTLMKNSDVGQQTGTVFCSIKRTANVSYSLATATTILSSGLGEINATVDLSRFSKLMFYANNVDERGILCVNGYLIVYTDPAGNYVYNEGAMPCSANPDTADEHDYTPPPVDVTSRITSTGSVTVKVGIRNFYGPGNGVVTFGGFKCMTGYTPIPGTDQCYRKDTGEYNSCSSYEDDSSCRLQQEKTCDADGNCVFTVLSGRPTGQSVSPSCKYFTNGDQTFSVCYDWWEKQRTYICEQGSPPQIDYTRVDRLNSSVAETGTGVSYQDTVLQDDTWTDTGSQGFQLSLEEWVPECVLGCKVAKWVDPNQAPDFTYTGQLRYEGGQYQYEFRLCNDDLCPVFPGETVVQGCQCLNAFNEAVLGLEAIRQASIDMICSTGQKGD